MQLKEIMTRDVITTSGEERIVTAAQRMRDANIGCLVVTNAGKVDGIITDRDLTVGCISEGHDPYECRVSEHMSTPAIAAKASMDILDAANLMVQGRVKRLPVIENGQLLGVVSFADLAPAMEHPIHELLVGMGAARSTI